MDIKDRLRNLPGKKPRKREKSNNKAGSSQSPKANSSTAASQDAYLFNREIYEPDFQQGNYALGELKELPLEQAKFLFKNRSDYQLAKEELIFLDTETSGLAGGAGTVVFLVGLGYFREDNFILEQHLMRDFEEELDQLLAVKSRLEERRAVVSFNGKSFDLPLLENRFVLNRLSFPAPEYHLDLLHPSRSLWNHLPSCSLKALERQLLNYSRRGDIDGSEVPELYFSYLRKKDMSLLEPVLHHNRLDIISLVALAVHLEKTAGSTEYNHLSAQELYNLGRILERENRRQASIECLEKSYRQVRSTSRPKKKMLEKIEKNLSWQYKRVVNWEAAVTIWQRMIEEKRGEYFARIELAKFLEHQQADFAGALEHSRAARSWLFENRHWRDDWRQKLKEVEHRIERLNNRSC